MGGNSAVVVLCDNGDTWQAPFTETELVGFCVGSPTTPSFVRFVSGVSNAADMAIDRVTGSIFIVTAEGELSAGPFQPLTGISMAPVQSHWGVNSIVPSITLWGMRLEEGTTTDLEFLIGVSTDVSLPPNVAECNCGNHSTVFVPHNGALFPGSGLRVSRECYGAFSHLSALRSSVFHGKEYWQLGEQFRFVFADTLSRSR